MHTEWLRELDKDLSFYWEIIFWEATLKYPMAESLMKTGWLDAMTDILDGTKTAGCIKLSSKTYYGVFWRFEPSGTECRSCSRTEKVIRARKVGGDMEKGGTAH